MSASVLTSADLTNATLPQARPELVQTFRPASKWSPENFGREQIRGLVRRVFFPGGTERVRQVVFCAAEPETEVGSICWQVAESLALDTLGNVAVASRNRQPSSRGDARMVEEVAIAAGASMPPCPGATRIHRNLWLVPRIGPVDHGGDMGTPLSSRMCELRRAFAYSIVQGPGGDPGEVAALGQEADGIVLVLAAHVTRRATAVKIKQTLVSAHVRLLGMVLSERRFPIPEAVYRRL